MDTISIMLNVDQEKIHEYWVNQGKPSTIAMGPSNLLRHVYMVTETGHAVEAHATSNLIIKVKPGDEVRWYETPIQPDAAYSICIKDILTKTGWATYVINENGDLVVTRDEQTLSAYYMDGGLKANSHSMDFSSATIKSTADIGEATLPMTLYYDFNLSLVEMVDGLPTLKCTLTFDPGILISND